MVKATGAGAAGDTGGGRHGRISSGSASPASPKKSHGDSKELNPFRISKGVKKDGAGIVNKVNKGQRCQQVGIWEPCESVYQRSDLVGRPLQDWIRKTYVDKPDILVPFRQPGSKKRYLKRSAINNRNQFNTRAKYKAIIKQEGIVVGARGEIITIPAEDDSCEYVLGGAHMIEAFYEAEDEDPKHDNIIATALAGIKVTRLDKRTPVDVQRYFKQIGNILNNLGSGNSFSETYLELPEMNKSYAAQRKQLLAKKKRKQGKHGKQCRDHQMHKTDKCRKGAHSPGSDSEGAEVDDEIVSLDEDVDDVDVDEHAANSAEVGERGEPRGKPAGKAGKGMRQDGDDGGDDSDDTSDADGSDDEFGPPPLASDSSDNEAGATGKRPNRKSKQVKKKKKSQAGEETAHWEWLRKNHPDSFVGYNSYKSATRFVKKMSHPMVDQLITYMNYVDKFCIGTDSTIKNDVVYHINYKILCKLEKANIMDIVPHVLLCLHDQFPKRMVNNY